MWINRFLFLWLIGTVKYKSTPIPTDCARHVQRCPVEKVQWEQNNDQLNCTTDFRYVCLRDTDGYFFETCMANFIIQANSSNCPTLYACYKNRPYLGKETTYFYCSEDVSGCPPRNHAEYSIHQLYKYPRCVESNLSAEHEYTSTITTINRSMDTSTDHVKRQEEKHAISVIVASITLIVAGCIFCCVLQTRRKRIWCLANKEETTVHLRQILEYAKVTHEENQETFKGRRTTDLYCQSLAL